MIVAILVDAMHGDIVMFVNDSSIITEHFILNIFPPLIGQGMIWMRFSAYFIGKCLS